MVAWAYPCRSFIERTASAPDGAPLIYQSCNDWAACEPCYQLIEAGDRAGLARRAYEATPVEPALKAGWEKARRMVPEAELIAQIRQLHDRFFASRLGPALAARTPAERRYSQLNWIAAGEAAQPVDSRSGPFLLAPVVARAILAFYRALTPERQARLLGLDWPKMVEVVRRCARDRAAGGGQP